MFKTYIFFLLIFLTLFSFNCSEEKKRLKKSKIVKKIRKKRVLLIDSYHSTYELSLKIRSGIYSIFNTKINKNGNIDNSKSSIFLRLFEMDTKRKRSEKYKKDIALKAKKVIEEWKPDLIIASDDNASKYVISPYYRNSEIPVVFCGVNWDASVYGFPCDNITGIVDVTLIKKMIDSVKNYSKGDKIGVLSANLLTDSKEVYHYKKTLKKDILHIYVTNFKDWKKGYIELQNRVDILLLGAPLGFPDWNKDEAKKFIYENSTIPSLARLDFISDYVLITHAKSQFEQGSWAAKTALKILNGESPKNIPISQNREIKTVLNMKLAKKLNIKFPIELIEKSTLMKEYK